MHDHTPECLGQMAAAAGARAAWRARWPRHCTACEGRGGAGESYDPSPAGVGLAAGLMYDWYPCQCVEAGRCPRCGAQGMADLDRDCEVCPSCGWDVRRPDALPAEPCCVCHPLGY